MAENKSTSAEERMAALEAENQALRQRVAALEGSAGQTTSHPDQPFRFAQQKKEGVVQTLNIDEVFEPQLLKGKRVLVTGGNRGLGLAMVRALVDCGAEVLATCRRSQGELAELGDAVQVITGVDVTKDEDMATLVAGVGEAPLDVLINNAGYFMEGHESIVDGTLDFAEELTQIDICSVGMLRTTNALYGAGKLQGGSKVAMITSQGGSIQWRDVQCPDGGDYGHHMSKASANMMGKLVANELRSKGVAVSILHPGFNRTGMTAKYAEIWDIEGAVEAPVGGKRVLHEVNKMTLETTGQFINCEDGLNIPW